MKLIIPACFIAYALSSASAQTVPGTRLNVSVEASSVVRTGDTVSVTYRLSNAATSAEPLWRFMVEAPAAGLLVTAPGSPTLWYVSTRFLDQPMAIWGVLDTALLGRGKSSPPLTYRAVGVPAIVTARIQGYTPPIELVEDSLRAAPDPLGGMIAARVVGIATPAPNGKSPSALARQLLSQLVEACALDWIADKGICNSLNAKVANAIKSLDSGGSDAARNQIQAFVREVDAQRGKHVSESAWQLLHANGTYLAALL